MKTKKPTTLELLEKHGACPEATEWAKPFKSPSNAWKKCKNPQWMLWALSKLGKLDEKRARLFAVKCIRETPLNDGRVVLDLLTDQRSRDAVDVAERFANGAATESELSAARSAARSAAGSAAGSAAWSAAWSAARSAAGSAAWSAAGSAAWSAAWSAAGSAAWSAAGLAAWSAAGSAAGSAQCNFIRLIFGNPFTTAQPPATRSHRRRADGSGQR